MFLGIFTAGFLTHGRLPVPSAGSHHQNVLYVLYKSKLLIAVFFGMAVTLALTEGWVYIFFGSKVCETAIHADWHIRPAALSAR